MANSNALVVAVSALSAYKEMGSPEGLIPLAHAIIYVSESAKSNSVILAKYKAEELVKNFKDDNIPAYLKNNNNLETENPKGYKYPHDFGGYTYQKYLPDSLKNEEFYFPSNNGEEKNMVRKKIKK